MDLELDANKIMDHLNTEWANDLAHAKKNIAILIEENRVLREEIETLKGENK